jgi:hypothetical protein
LGGHRHRFGLWPVEPSLLWAQPGDEADAVVVGRNQEMSKRCRPGRRRAATKLASAAAVRRGHEARQPSYFFICVYANLRFGSFLMNFLMFSLLIRFAPLSIWSSGRH